MVDNNICFNKRCNDHKCVEVLTNLKTCESICNVILGDSKFQTFISHPNFCLSALHLL